VYQDVRGIYLSGGSGKTKPIKPNFKVPRSAAEGAGRRKGVPEKNKENRTGQLPISISRTRLISDFSCSDECVLAATRPAKGAKRFDLRGRIDYNV
jgi:hypothetical protein